MATWIVNNYKNHDLEWIKEYKPDNVIVYDKTINNVGYNIYDYLDYIVNNYHSLPEVVLFVKGNMLERHITKEEFDEIVDNKTFTPILTQHHGTYMPVCYYEDGLYYERNDSWYMQEHESKFFKTYGEFADEMGLPNPTYLGFAPGACYIVPKENILKRSLKFYKKLIHYVDYCAEPAEAHLIERSLHEIWS
jgi:hypothetical protein